MVFTPLPLAPDRIHAATNQPFSPSLRASARRGGHGAPNENWKSAAWMRAKRNALVHAVPSDTWLSRLYTEIKTRLEVRWGA